MELMLSLSPPVPRSGPIYVFDGINEYTIACIYQILMSPRSFLNLFNLPEHPAPANPWHATCSNASTLVFEGSQIYFLSPSNVMAPELPPSTTVVTPLCKQVSSGFTPNVVAY